MKFSLKVLSAGGVRFGCNMLSLCKRYFALLAVHAWCRVFDIDSFGDEEGSKADAFRLLHLRLPRPETKR